MEKTYLQQVGVRLAECRTQNFFSRKELAERAGVTVDTIKRMERGEKAVGIDEATKICNALNSSIDYILTGKCGLREWIRLNQKFLSLPNIDSENMQRMVEIFWNHCPRKLR